MQGKAKRDTMSTNSAGLRFHLAHLALTASFKDACLTSCKQGKNRNDIKATPGVKCCVLDPRLWP